MSDIFSVTTSNRLLAFPLSQWILFFEEALTELEEEDLFDPNSRWGINKNQKLRILHEGISARVVNLLQHPKSSALKEFRSFMDKLLGLGRIRSDHETLRVFLHHWWGLQEILSKAWMRFRILEIKRKRGL